MQQEPLVAPDLENPRAFAGRAAKKPRLQDNTLMASLSTSPSDGDPKLGVPSGLLHLAPGAPVGVALTVGAKMRRDAAKAKDALARLRERTANVKPDARGGATAAVRRLRDGR